MRWNARCTILTNVCVSSEYQIEHTYCAYMPIDERWTAFVPFFFVFVFKTVRASHAIIAHLLHACSFFLSVCLSACRRVNLNIIQANTHIVQCSFCIFWNHADAHASIWAAENKIESRLYNLPLCHCNWDWEWEWKRNGDVWTATVKDLQCAILNFSSHLKSSHSHLTPCASTFYG